MAIRPFGSIWVAMEQPPSPASRSPRRGPKAAFRNHAPRAASRHRAGIRRIILPSRNEADVDDIPEDVRNDLQIVFVSGIGEVIDAALEVLVANPPPLASTMDSARAGRHSDPEPQPLTVKG